MKKTEISAVIKYLYLKRMTASKIHDDMLRTVTESASLCATLRHWIREFKAQMVGAFTQPGP